MHIIRQSQYYFMLLILILASMGSAQAATLTTTYTSNNSQGGNMFDITALSDVTITGFDHHLNAAIGVSVTVEVYGKVGTFVGSETTSGNWLLLGSTVVASAGPGVGTPIPLSLNIPILTGSSHAFYITVAAGGGSTNYTNGTAVGNVYIADAAIQILEGAGKSYPFAATFTPRVWNGTVHYNLGAQPQAVPTLSEWTLLVLILSLGLLGFQSSKKKYKF